MDGREQAELGSQNAFGQNSCCRSSEQNGGRSLEQHLVPGTSSASSSSSSFVGLFGAKAWNGPCCQLHFEWDPTSKAHLGIGISPP